MLPRLRIIELTRLKEGEEAAWSHSPLSNTLCQWDYATNFSMFMSMNLENSATIVY
jgi:hypothetical protein